MGLNKLLIASFFCVLPLTGFAAKAPKVNVTTEEVGMSNRMLRKAGVYLGVLGDPFPTLLGVNIGYNLTDFMRATAGLGRVSASIGSAEASATTLGAGARFFMPGWSLSPVVGASVAYVAVSQSGGASVTVGNFTKSQAHVYANIGLDWQAASGFNVGAGYNLSFMAGIGGLPYLNLGWYFDLI